MLGLVLSSIGGNYKCLVDGETVVIKPRGVFRFKNVTIKPGDSVEIAGSTITKVYERKNSFVRPDVSNVDKVVIVTSIVEPMLNYNLLDRLIISSEYMKIKPLLCFTKTDLASVPCELNYYRNLGYELVFLPKESGKLKEALNEGINVLVGQTGTGKTTLINKLLPELNLLTNEISKALGRGKHTTTATELIKYQDGFIADTPGFGVLDFAFPSVELKNYFREFTGSVCKYSGCLHLKEPGCIVKKEAEASKMFNQRYQNYLRFFEEIKKRENLRKEFK